MAELRTMTPDERAAIRARAEAATPGPWKADLDEGRSDFYGFPIKASVVTPGWTKYGYSNADAAFIAAARTDVPALLDDNARLEAEKAELEAELVWFKRLAHEFGYRP